MVKATGKKIVPLRYDTWNRFTEWKNECYQILPTFIHQKVYGEREQYIRSRVRTSSCPACNTALVRREEHPELPRDHTGTREWYSVCEQCGFWKYELRDDVYLPFYDIPYVKRFSYEQETPSILYLSHEIQKNREKVFSMSPSKFEEFVGSVLADFLECEVHHVGQTGDDGIDLIALIGDNPLMIQVKRRESPEKTESVDVVKLLFASAFARGANSGMIVTSAKRFTKPAENWIESARIRDIGFNLELVDINSLMSMIDAVLQKNSPPPWEVHSHRERKYLTNQDKNWTTVNISDGDLVFRTHDGNFHLVAFEHADLNKCYMLQTNKNLTEIIYPDMRFTDFKKLVEPHAKLEVFHEEQAINVADTLSSIVKDKLERRWISLFPTEIFDFS